LRRFFALAYGYSWLLWGAILLLSLPISFQPSMHSLINLLYGVIIVAILFALPRPWLGEATSLEVKSMPG
jgi:hypothetical protein